jgi:hypothetical protein
VALAIAFGTAQAQEAPQQFTADLTSLNASSDSDISPVTGTADVTVDGDEVTIEVEASGLEPGSAHIMHIHLSDTCPDPDADTNDDGFVDIEEATAVHGGALVMLDSDPSSADAGDPVEADDSGDIDYTQTISIDDLTAELPDGEDLDLGSRTVEIHGVDDSVELPDSVASAGDASASETLPVACGEFEAVDADETAGAADTTPEANSTPSATPTDESANTSDSDSNAADDTSTPSATNEDSEDDGTPTVTTSDDVPNASLNGSTGDEATTDTADTESTDDDNASTDTAQAGATDENNNTADTARTESTDDDNTTADTTQTESTGDTSTPSANRSSGTPTPPIISANTGAGSNNSNPSANNRPQRSTAQSVPAIIPPTTGDAGLHDSQSSAGSMAVEAGGIVAILSLAGLGVYGLKRRQS